MQLVAGVAGAVVGFFVGGPAGAAYGFQAGVLAYGLFGPKPQGPGPGDLKRPQLTLGAQMARVYGRTRRPVHVVWASDFRATEVEQDGKGLPEGPSSYTYSLDLLGWIADGSNVIGVTRIWINNKLYYTALADSDTESIEASGETPQWDDFTFLPGTDAQTPYPVYEDAVGATEAPAYRGVASIGFENFQCGTSKQVPFIEVEVVTAADQANDGEVILFRFDDDESEVGGRTVTVNGTPVFDSAITVFNGAGEFGGEEAVTVPVTMVSPGALPITLECWFRQSADLQSTDINVFMELQPVVGGSNYLRLGWRNNGFQFISDTGEGIEYLYEEGAEPIGTWVFVRACFDPADGQMWLFVNGVLLANDVIPTLIGGAGPGAHQVLVGQKSIPNAPNTDGLMWIDDSRTTIGRLRSTSNFSIPAAPLPYDPLSVFEPLPVDLQVIVDAELDRVAGLESSDWDSSNLAGVDVTGFTAIGSASQSIADISDIYHFDLVPGAPIRFVRRSANTFGSIPVNSTGAGVDESGDPFTGLKIGNNDESPAVVGLRYPNISQDHDIDFQSGDRLTTDGPDIRRVETNVVLTPEEARGRAFSATVIQRSAAKTATFGISDAHAAAEPGDAYTVTDIDENVYNLRIKRFNYADGVKQCDWELNDISALVDELDTETDYEEAITVAPAGTATLLLIDGPLLRDADNAPGFYAAITIAGAGGATLYGSVDDTSYSAIGSVARSATTGTCTALGDWGGGWVWDEINSVTVILASGSATLASSTHAAMYADERVNSALIGVHGRWELVRFRQATLTGTRTYLLSGFLRGGKGTEFAIGDHETGDNFVLLNDSGMLRVTQLADEIGVLRYFKAVPDRRAVASVNGQAFTCQSECLEPRSVVDIRVTDGMLTWDRRTRLSAPTTGEPPLGEASEAYQVQIYDELDALVNTTTVYEPSMQFGQAVLDVELSQAISYAALIGGVLYGIWEWGTAYHDKRLIGRNVATDTGTYLSDTLTNARIDAVVYVGSTAYVAATDLTPGGTTDQTYLHRVSLSSSTIAATWSPTPYDQLTDLYWDGTYIWAYGRASGSLTQHNATTLAVINTYDAPDRGGISFGGSMAAGGGLFYAISDVDEVQGFVPASLPAVTWTAGLSGTSAYDLVYAGSLLFVMTNTGVIVLDPTDGTVIETYTDGITSGLYIDGSDVVYELLGNTLRWLDGSTGAVSREVGSPSFGSFAGATNGQLVFYSATNSSIGTTRLYDVIASLTGYTVVIAQISETVGTGHEAEITL